MKPHYGLAVLVGVASLLSIVQSDVSCTGVDGRAGETGIPGRDGWPGVKGEKGEPAVMATGPVDPSVLLRLKGERGSRGAQGPTGPKGYRGDLGAAGHPGVAGPRGPHGRSHDQQSSNQEAHSAFSVIRQKSAYPAFGKKLTYDAAVINNPEDFNITSGIFTCRTAGVYYFTFHSVAKASLCLGIDSDALENMLVFCDYIRRYEQVLSGGVVLQLDRDQTVWLESVRDQQTSAEARDNREKKIIFNGFLLFPNAA